MNTTEWSLIDTKSVIDDKARQLRRKCRGHYYSNYIWFSDAIAKQFPYSKFWIYENGDNMLLLQQYDTFFKLFYFLGDIDALQMSLPDEVKSSRVLCELFDEDEKDKQKLALDKLCSLGFSVYRKFYMWECTKSEINHKVISDEEGRKISYGDSISNTQLKELFEAFDPYVDLIPTPELFEDYYNSKHYLTCLIDDVLAGVVVYTLKENVVDEDFIYVYPEYRGIGKILYKEFMNKVFYEHCCRTIVPWIHTDNVRSIAFHTKVGAKRTSYYKISLLLNN